MELQYAIDSSFAVSKKFKYLGNYNNLFANIQSELPEQISQ